MMQKANKLKKQKAYNISTYAIVGFIAIIMIYPLVYAFLGSIVSTKDFYDSVFLPWANNDGFTFQNYAFAFDSKLIQPILVTLFRCFWYMVVVLFTTITCSFMFTFENFKGKKIAFAIIMSSMLIPGVALMMPTYVFFARFPLVGGNDIFGSGGSGFIDNPAILFIPGMFSAYNIFLFRQALYSIGNGMKEAAEVDGANVLQIMFFMYVPLLRALISVVLINIFIGQWNDYMGPLIYIPYNVDWHPIGLASVNIIANYTNSGIAGSQLIDYPISYAIAIVMLLPPIVCFMIMQKQFISGLSMGAIKG